MTGACPMKRLWKRHRYNSLKSILCVCMILSSCLFNPQGKEGLVSRIVQVCESDLAAHPHLYNLQSSIATGLDTVTAKVKAEKMIASRDLKISEFPKNTRVYEQAVRFLQAKVDIHGTILTL